MRPILLRLPQLLPPSPPPLAAFQARWLVGLLSRGPAAAKEAFSIIPESVVRDMMAWLRWAQDGQGWQGVHLPG